MCRLSFRRTVTNGAQPKAKHAVVGFVLLIFFFFFLVLLENHFGRANDNTTNRSSTICHSNNFQLFTFYDPPASKTWSLSLATANQISTHFTICGFVLSRKTFSHSWRIAFTERAGNNFYRTVHPFYRVPSSIAQYRVLHTIHNNTAINKICEFIFIRRLRSPENRAKPAHFKWSSFDRGRRSHNTNIEQPHCHMQQQMENPILVFLVGRTQFPI